MLALCDVEPARREKFPARRMVREKRPDKRSRNNDEAPAGFDHELLGTATVHRHEKTIQPASEIPDETWFLELDRGKFRAWLQIRSRFLE